MCPTTMMDRLERARHTLSFANQQHVLRYYDQLPEAGRRRLLDEIESVDWVEVARLIESHVRCERQTALPAKVDPVPWYPHKAPPSLVPTYDRARSLGEDLIRQGKVAAFTVAGGQGTRLSWDGPKGTFGATPLRKLPLLACLGESILAVERKHQVTIPWYIMTSTANDQATRRFLQDQDYFGLRPPQVMLFTQGMMPAIEPGSGQVLLEAPDRLALSPNGHGGSLRALGQSKALHDMMARGVEQISYTQVDNPLVRVVDPLFIGLHALNECQMSSKALRKTRPEEKVGVFCLIEGKVTVIEYSDLPVELARQRAADGTLRFGAGSIAIHLIRADFVASLNASASGGLPFHRALKKVGCIDPKTGRTIEPAKPNAVKLEMFVFDALPLCDRSIVYEVDRVDEFAPIKNAEAADLSDSVDSPSTSRSIQIERAARWLEAHGVKVPRDAGGRVQATIEIRPTTALEAADLAAGTLPETVEPGAELLI